jgi:CO dehydrogenase maturation factor
MKIAVAGKGGVGKTFFASTLSRLLAREGYNVLAVDADPNINLGYSLGVSSEITENIVPLSDNEALIREKTGVAPTEALGAMFNMTPTVNDIVERFGVEAPDGVKLLVMGTVKGGDTGCMCGANALLRVLVQHLLIQRKDILIMDMVAGLEHLGRGTARRMDAMIVILEPRMKSVDTLKRILKMASEIEVKEIFAVGNKVATEAEKEFIKEKMKEQMVPVIANIPYDISVAEADMKGIPVIDYKDTEAVQAIGKVKDFLLDRYKP